MRPVPFETNAYYHVFNRGVDKRNVFPAKSHFVRFLKAIRNILDTGSATNRSPHNQSLALNSTESYQPPIAIICYCLMPNHYHFLLYQKSENAISEFMHKLDTSYTKFFDLNHKRTGRVFEYTFKAKRIESDEQLLHVSRYIHLNPLIAGITSTLSTYRWSSYPDYIGLQSGTLCEKNPVLGHFHNDPKKYEAFVNNQIAYAALLHQIQREQKEEDLYL